jgi:hypothetical protein
MINVHSPEARYAAHELHHFLTRVVDEPILLEGAGKAGRTCTLVIKPSQSHEVMIHNDASLTTISGRSEASLLHGVYCFLEKLGYVFTARGPVHPAALSPWPAPFTYKHTPPLPRRGIRQHINFPMDISCLPLESAMEYVRNLARMKLNFIGFHLYPNQGWLQMDYKGYQVGMDDQTTLYYSERHSVCGDPAVRAQTANKETWFIPEFEPHYRGPDQHKLLRSWLREVMRCAKTCGMTVCASVESLSPASDKELAVIGEPAGPDLYARVTAELAFAALEQYPEIDQIEIISRENEGSWPSPKTIREAAAKLRQEFAMADADWPATPAAMPGEPEEMAAAILTGSARQVQVALRAMGLMSKDERAAKLLAGRTPVCALYDTIYQTMPGLGALVSRLLPPDMKFALLPAYSSRRTARNLAAANLPPELLGRTRVYSWCEFDGLMYLLQNECEGLYRCIDQAAGSIEGQPAELACNHWRTSENELSLDYLAAGAFGGIAPQEFYRSYLGALMGPQSAPRLAKALAELDEATVFAVEHLFNLGFCSLGCWSLSNVGWSPQDIGKYKAMLGKVARQIAAEAPSVSRPEGLERCTLWVNRLEASQIHCDVVGHLCAMRDLVDWNGGKLVPSNPPTHAGLLPDENRDAFCRHVSAARKLAQQYVALCAQALPDRMSEGTLTSYEHVMPGLLDKTLAQFVGADAPAIEDGQSPPSPLG